MTLSLRPLHNVILPRTLLSLRFSNPHVHLSTLAFLRCSFLKFLCKITLCRGLSFKDIKYSLLLLLGILSILAGCGFEPVHRQPSRHNSTDYSGQEIEIADIPGRYGQVLQNTLEDSFHPSAEVVDTPRYRLAVSSLNVGETPIAIEKDRRITRYQVTLVAAFTVTDLKNNTVLYSDQVRMVTSYDSVDSGYATFIAKEDKIKLLAEEAAEEIKIRALSHAARDGL